MSQNVVYKTFELNTDIEHKAKPINLSGATTIKLTELPTGVKCWISTESNGTNLFPLVNRGDGWVNMPNPLYNLYIYTEGTTLDNQKILLNFTGQNDFFAYGNNSSERIDKVGKIESFAPQALMELNNAIYNLYNKPKLIKTIKIQGEYKESTNQGSFEKIYACLPLTEKINGLKLDNNKFYKIDFFGHIDIGNGTKELEDSLGRAYINAHLCLFNNTANATFTLQNSQDIDNFFLLDKVAWNSEKTDLFDIWGLKFVAFRYNTEQVIPFYFQDKGLNFLKEAIFQGSLINSYEDIGLFVNSGNGNNGGAVYMHSSLLINLYEMQQIF